MTLRHFLFTLIYSCRESYNGLCVIRKLFKIVHENDRFRWVKSFQQKMHKWQNRTERDGTVVPTNEFLVKTFSFILF